RRRSSGNSTIFPSEALPSALLRDRSLRKEGSGVWSCAIRESGWSAIAPASNGQDIRRGGLSSCLPACTGSARRQQQGADLAPAPQPIADLRIAAGLFPADGARAAGLR